MIIVPVAWNAVLTFQDVTFRDLADGRMTGPLTLEKFLDTLTSGGFWRTLWVTVGYSVASTFGSILVGLLAALVFRRAFPGRGVFRAIMLLPYVAPVVAVTFVWTTMLNPQFGIVNYYGTRWLGWDQAIDFLGRSPYALLTVIGFEIWRYSPFAFMFLTARVGALPADIEEAALVDGVTPTQNFRHIVLPQLMPTIALLTVLRLIMTFNKFDDVFLLTGGSAGTEVAAVRVYTRLMGSFDIGGAAATALVMAMILGMFLMIYTRLTSKKEA
ncbi:MAG: carbohydrate ABC transporter permease [Georgenia sp.]